jgi:Prealbumin-like fold domain
VLAAEQCDDDLDGRVDFLGLPALTALIIAETVAPDGYAAGPDFPVTLAEGDNFIGFPNSLLPPTSNLRVIKTQDTTSGPVVPGACFTIFAYGEGGTRGDIVADQQCDDDLDGNVDFVGLPALTALIVAETVAPEGYAPGADFPITLAEGDNAIGFPNSLLPVETPTATATTGPAEPTATTGPAEPTSTTSTNPAPTGTTTVTTLPSTGTGTGSSSSLSLTLIAALLTLVVISGGYLITKRRNA